MPEDVEVIDDLDTLRWLYDKYHMPASQPQTVEESMYQCLMRFHLGVKIDALQKYMCYYWMHVFLLFFITYNLNGA